MQYLKCIEIEVVEEKNSENEGKIAFFQTI